MRLIHDNQIIAIEEIEQCVRCGTRFHTRQYPGIILDARTKSCLLQHLHIELCPLTDTLCFQQLVILLEICHLLL